MRERLLESVRSRLSRFRDTNDAGAVLSDDALAEAAALWAAVPEPESDLAVVQALGLFHWYRFLAGEDPDDLQAATSLLQPVFRLNPELVPELLRVYFGQAESRAALAEKNNEAVALMNRYKQSGDLAFLVKAIDRWQRMAEDAPEGDPIVTQTLPNLAIAQRRLFERTGDQAALAAAIQTGRQAIAAVPTSDPNLHIAALTGLGNALRRLAAQADDADALTEAVDLGRRAVAVATAAADEHLLLVARSSLANALHRQWARTLDLATLTEVTQLFRQVAAATPEGAPDAAAAWSNLCDALHDVYWNTGDPAALEEAISAGRQAVARAEDRRDEQARYMSYLSSSLLRMFERTGDRILLEESVELIRRAVAQTEETHPELPVYLNALGSALLRSYENSGDLDRLREAVAAAERATRGQRPNPAHLSNLAICLRTMFERTGDAEALDRAEQSARDALTADRHAEPDAAAFLSNLGGILLSRFQDSADRRSLEEAVQVLREAVAVAPADHHDKAQYRSHLAGALGLLHRETHDPSTLAEAVAVARTSVTPGQADNPQRAGYLLNLGGLLEVQGNFGDARDVHAEASALPTAPASTRIDAARRWGRCAMRRADTADAIAAFEAAIALLPQITTRRLSLDDREYGLERIGDLAANAAAAAVADGRLERAVELLEQSRGLLVDQAMEAHRDLSEIRAVAPALAEQYEQLRRQIGALDQARTGGADFIARARSDLDEQWHALIRRIREVPALKDFLRPPPIETLSEQAADGPVVMVYTTQWRSDALVLTADPDQPVRLVSLPDLTPEQVMDQVVRLLEAHWAAFNEDSSLGQRRQAQDTLRSVLGWLWDTVCGRVCDVILPPAYGAIRPHVWWCPVGPLALLPLHAAGQHDGDGHSVVDRAISSYTATIRALGDMRHERRAQRNPREKAALIVAVPDAEGAEPLAGVGAEVAELIRLLPSATVLSSEGATAERVLAALPRHEVAHFACHGISNWQVPRESQLVLSDYSAAPLMVTEMSGLDLAHAELAYLSACSTTMPALRLLDESIHITGAFQLAGYRHVIGTLWPVSDLAAVRFAAMVYSDLTDNGRTFPRTTRAAEAVWAATCHMRDSYPANPAMWMAHIHVGA